jgi:hypothetical protein
MSDIIKSNRKFGVEIEVYADCSRSIDKMIDVLRTQKYRDYSVHSDGSIQGPNGREYVTPPLVKKDVPTFISFVKHIKEAGFKVDPSCGLHVHFGVEEYLQDTLWDVIPASELISKYGKTKLNKVIFIKKELNTKENVNALKHFFPPTEQEIHDFGGKIVYTLPNCKENTVLKYNRINVAKTVYVGVVDKGLYDKFQQDHYKIRKDRDVADALNSEPLDFRIPPWDIEYKEKKQKLLSEFDKKVFEQATFTGNDYVIVEYYNTTTHQTLKNIFAFYLVFSDVMQMFLPKTRRNNRYCQDLLSKYTLKEIQDIKSFEDFDKVWYKEHKPDSIRRMKGEKYHSSRYYAVNFHSLSRHKTIEIRSHSGTTNIKKILYWVALHQSIIDTVAEDKNFDTFIESVNSITDKDTKLQVFYEYIKAPKDMVKYLNSRINILKN